VQTEPVQVALRETLSGPVTVTGRHVKQSGGHGQYAVVGCELTPLPPGSGIVYETRVVGGVVPSQFHGSVEKGVRAEAAHRGLVDVRVVLVDGKSHAVDSSDAAFQAAGALAVREAVAAAGVTVLEPYAEVAVSVPPGFVGTVMSDLSGRRARVLGSEPGEDVTVVRAEVPETALLTYASELRAISHGTGTYTRRYLRHEPQH
jgi:elongation factor G